jgi:hypothetical protein
MKVYRVGYGKKKREGRRLGQNCYCVVGGGVLKFSHIKKKKGP